MFEEEALDGSETMVVEPRHALSPAFQGRLVKECGARRVDVYQGKGNPLNVTLANLVDVFQRERAGGEVAWVGIVLTTLHEEAVEVLVGDDGLAANDEMTAVVDGFGNARNGTGQMGDVSTDVSVATCDHL